MANVYSGINNITVDPQFAAPSLNDFRLATGSPCIEVGDNSRVPIDVTDLDEDDDVTEQLPWALVKNYIRIASNQPPPSAGVVDMGAHERPAVIN